MRQLFYIVLLASITLFMVSCDKIDSPDKSSAVLTFEVKNTSEFDFDNFSFTIFDENYTEEYQVVFGAIKQGESVEITSDKAVDYMISEYEGTFAHFGHNFTAIINGVEGVFNFGICGTGLMYENSDSGTFFTEVFGLDIDLNNIYLHQEKL